jgi:hypothetical protein
MRLTGHPFRLILVTHAEFDAAQRGGDPNTRRAGGGHAVFAPDL